MTDGASIVDRYKLGSYWLNKVTEDWKVVCEPLPCYAGLAWSSYLTTVRTYEIYTVQLWLGHCQKFFGSVQFPGGYGAEVGVYKVASPTDVPGLEQPGSLDAVANIPHWYPVIDPAPFRIALEIQYRGLKDGKSHTFIPKTDAPKTYWQTRWMEPDSFEEFRNSADSGGPGNCPDVQRMTLRYWFNEVEQEAWQPPASAAA